MERKKKLGLDKCDEEVYSNFRCETNEEEVVNFVDKGKMNVIFEREIDVDQDSLDFYNFVYCDE